MLVFGSHQDVTLELETRDLSLLSHSPAVGLLVPALVQCCSHLRAVEQCSA